MNFFILLIAFVIKFQLNNLLFTKLIQIFFNLNKKVVNLIWLFNIL